MPKTKERSLQGLHVAITGAARGIGRATAAAFLAEGARVTIGDINAELVKRAAEDLAASGGEVTGLRLDVSDPSSFEDFLTAAEARHGDLDVLVNNAGIMPTGRFLDEDPSMTRRQLDVNVVGVLNGSRLAAERFTARGRGHLVNVASLAGVSSEAELATYCGTKHFVVGFSESLHRELIDDGILVTTVLPGVINTELSAGTKVPEWASRLSRAEPEDVAAGIVRAVVEKRIKVVVPASLGIVMSSFAVLPPRARHRLTRALGADQIATGAEPTARAAYHSRILDDAS
ncbi:MAG: SDR family oxidoreductase [Marmoricola sp.]